MDLRRYRLEHGLDQKTVVRTLRPLHPKISTATISMVENPADYGVQLLPATERFLTEAVETGCGRGKKREYILRCRVTGEQAERFKRLTEESGFATVADFVRWWCLVWLRQKESAAPNDTEDGAHKKNND